jgi:RNA polymerase sigma-54 factor
MTAIRLAHTLEARQQQTQRIDPRQILASEIMAWTTAELESAVEREMAENPALETRDGEPFTPLYTGTGSPDGAVGSYANGSGPNSVYSREDGGPTRMMPSAAAAALEEDDPLERVASNLSLHDHLRDQVGQVTVDSRQAALVRYLIESVDDRGYLVADLADLTEQFRVPASEVEQAVRALQTMDPPGVGARDLRECLTLQVEFLNQAGEAHPLALRILTHCWEELVAHREERIASRLRVTRPEVREAVTFLQKSLAPYPGGMFRASWQSRGTGSHAVRPDLVFHRAEYGFAVELTRDFETMLTVAPLWKRLSEQPDAGADESMRRYIRDHVDRAQSFMAGVTRRGQTLRRIAHSLVECQQGYLETGNRAFLRPLTRQALAERLSLDESVISRAVADKWAQLPSGEVVALDAFFGNAHAVREALSSLIAGEDPSNPYSDDEIADILTAQGFPLARRTVAKYRGLEKILPARLRKRSPRYGAEVLRKAA